MIRSFPRALSAAAQTLGLTAQALGLTALGLGVAVAGLSLTAGAAQAESVAVGPETTDAAAIMNAVENRAQGNRSKGKMVMTLTDKSGRQRQRALRTLAMDFEGGRRQLMNFEAPADVQGTALLSVDYDDGDKDDDQWLYLPSLHKSTRISSSEKSGSFMGTDLSFADMTQADPSHWNYAIVEQSAQVEGEPCWLIEATPKSDKAKKETGYVKTRLFISKNKMLPVRTKMWVAEGKKLKYIDFKDIKSVGGIWVAHTIAAKTTKGNETESTTLLQLADLSFDNADVTEDRFNQRTLEKGL